MKKICSLLFTSILLSKFTFPQVAYNSIGYLKAELAKAKEDSVKCRLALSLGSAYRLYNFDSSRFYADLCVQIANRLGLLQRKADGLSLKGFTLLESGRLSESLQCQYEALNISERINDTSNKALALNRIGNVYMELGDYRKANEYYFLSKGLYQAIRNYERVDNELSNIGNIFNLLNKPDSALYYLQMMYTAKLKTSDWVSYTPRGETMSRIGKAYVLKGDTLKAMAAYRQGIREAFIDHDIRNLAMNNLFLAKLFREGIRYDSSIKYANAAYNAGIAVAFKKGIFETAVLISELYCKQQQYDSAYKYLLISASEKDSISGSERFKELQQTILNELENKKEAETKMVEAANKQKQYILLGGLAAFVIIASYLYRNNKQKQKINGELGRTLSHLKSTQYQLIQSEKMASLGELTAGIAHEIQNPLNFVNNFSEINSELIKEMKQEIDKGNFDDAKFIANDIDTNEQKINHHGKRADAIVKGMLQHSRSNSGIKEPTDINALADEYLRLAYHGLRAKDKSFNATMQTDFDQSLGKLNVITQDLGRVILNLITNAFYAVTDKKKKGVENYEPAVLISTKKMGDKVMIKVRDNGMGIPQNVREKIFQPFFTTKPTGEGTGLGLSMSYDIITKGHGGEISVTTQEGEYTEFSILLPV